MRGGRRERAVASEGVWPDIEHPADPYPGAVPPVSYVHVDEVARGIHDGAVDGFPLDAWLRSNGAAPLAARLPVLAYGSNRSPSKITWLRRALGLGADPVVVLRARTTGVTAVWAAGLRARDGARPAVLAAAPGVVEQHAVWLATADQIAVLDRCEGRDERFRLASLRTGAVVVDGGALAAPIVDVVVERPWVYLGHAEIRRPLLVDGAPVRCVDVPQDVARTLAGESAATDGLDADTVTGAPHPDEWPAALFAYGLLQPGQASWRRVHAHATGPAEPATVAGGVFDTGHGYPAWLPDAPGDDAGRRRPGPRPGHPAPRPRRLRGTRVRARQGGGGRQRVLGLRLARRPGRAGRAAGRVGARLIVSSARKPAKSGRNCAEPAIIAGRGAGRAGRSAPAGWGGPGWTGGLGGPGGAGRAGRAGLGRGGDRGTGRGQAPAAAVAAATGSTGMR